MTQATLCAEPAPHVRSGEILRRSAMAWFAVALVGQLLFAFYVAAYFGAKLATSGTPGLSETHLTGGYIPGDAVGNAIIAAHLLTAVVIHGFGPLQLIPQIRNRFPVFHHFVGRAFVTAASIGALSGLYIVLVRGSGEGMLVDIANTVTATLILVFGFMTVRYAMKRDIDTHHRWALRFFLITSAFWFVRLGVYVSVYFAEFIGVPFSEIMPQVFAVVHIAKIAVPLGLLELYFRATDSAKPAVQYITAGVLVIAALFTGVAIYAVASMGWLPKVFG